MLTSYLPYIDESVGRSWHRNPCSERLPRRHRACPSVFLDKLRANIAHKSPKKRCVQSPY